MKKTATVFCAVFCMVFNSFGETLRYPVGETLSYQISWGIFPVGRTTISCEQIEENSTQLIHIQVKAKSNQLVSTLYPVNDQIDCYVSPATGLPLRIEKKTVEGDFVCHDILRFDRENQTARWESFSATIVTNYLIYSNTLDVASFLYALRCTPFNPGDSQEFNIAVDAYLHGLTITAEEKKEIKTILNKGKTTCTRYSVVPKRNDLFVRKIPDDIWVSDAHPRILVKMHAKTPLGKIRIVLDNITSAPAAGSD